MGDPQSIVRLRDPLAFAAHYWPHVAFYGRQEEVIDSVVANDETFVVAGHQLGKDFVAGFLCLWFFLTRHPVRVITTSVKDDHLRVLWGEIGRFIDTARFPLKSKEGGPLVVNHREVRKVWNGAECKVSYLRGMVSARGEGMQGHHAPHTLLVIDEATGVDDVVYERSDTWAKRKLVFSNPYGGAGFFYKAVRGGDVVAAERCYRKVLRVRAEDSPNVRLALAEQRLGLRPSGREVVPGVLSWAEYRKRRATWDPVRQCIGLDAEFWEGADALLYPPDWLNRAQHRARLLRGEPRRAKGIGIDPAEGGDKTAMAAVDELGLIELVAKKTPDTSVIISEALAFMRKHNVPAGRVCFDRGGGGKQLADVLRAQGHPVRTVAFGEPLAPEPRYGQTPVRERRQQREERYVYTNRRAQLYGRLRELLDPSHGQGFALPAEYAELRRQLAPIPLTYDGEGRMYLLPKRKKTPDGTEKTLTELLGCSPDEADALVLAIFAMQDRGQRAQARTFT